MRFLFYSHDGLGLGHTRRNLAIAGAVAELAPGTPLLLATGIDEVSQLGLPEGVGTLKLPSLRKTANGGYVARRLRLPAAELRTLRSELLLSAVKSFRPTVILVDKHPFGASGEFRSGLEEVRRQGGRVVLGLRDILDEPQAVQREWDEHRMLARIAEVHDLILVYGQAGVFDPGTAYRFPPALTERTRFCGYVVRPDPAPEDPVFPPLAGLPAPPVRPGNPVAREEMNGTRPIVLASAGGGEDGFFVLETFLRAARGAPWQGVAVAGPMTPAHDLKTLRRLAAEAHVPLHGFVPGLARSFWSVQALVCMGGYNTLAEALSKGLPAVCVPRILPRSEQLLRATAFKDRGLLQVLHPEALSVERLREEIQTALSVPRPELLGRVQAVLRFDGARQAASQLLALAASRTGEARAGRAGRTG